MEGSGSPLLEVGESGGFSLEVGGAGSPSLEVGGLRAVAAVKHIM